MNRADINFTPDFNFFEKQWRNVREEEKDPARTHKPANNSLILLCCKIITAYRKQRAMNAILVFYSYKKPWDQTAPKRLSRYASDLCIFLYPLIFIPLMYLIGNYISHIKMLIGNSGRLQCFAIKLIPLVIELSSGSGSAAIIWKLQLIFLCLCHI